MEKNNLDFDDKQAYKNGNGNIWFVDEISYYKDGWYVVSLIRHVKKGELMPTYVRNMLMPFQLLETDFLKSKLHIDSKNIKGKGIVKQGGYYEIKQDELWKYEDYYDCYCIIERVKSEKDIDDKYPDRIFDNMNLYLKHVEKLFSNEILPGSAKYPNLEFDIDEYPYYYNDIDVARDKISIDKTINNNLNSHMYIFSLNVGQGDTNIIVLPNNSVYIIDFYFYKYNENKFEDIYTNLKKIFKFDKVTGVIITHKHRDHIWGLSNIISKEYIEVEKIFINADYKHDISEITSIKNAAKEKKIPIININHPSEIKESNVNIEILNPKDGKSTRERCPDINDSSIVLKITFGDTEAFFTGDAGYNILNSCCNKTKRNSYLKVSHHGSETGTDEEFAKNINPQRVFISVGRDNIYGHPCAAVVNDYFEEVDISYESKDMMYKSDGNNFDKMSVNLSYNSNTIRKKRKNRKTNETT